MGAAKWLLVVSLGCSGNDKPEATAMPPRNAAQPAPEDDAARRDREAAAKAEADAALAVKEADEARAKLEAIMTELDAVETKISVAVTELADAQNDVERNTAAAKLKLLQREQAEIKQRAMDARAAAEKAERKKGTKISAECQANPLAQGCS